MLVSIVGVLLILQGWRSRTPRLDMVIAIDTAQRLLDHTEIPEKGILTSFGSFAPPGVTWIVTPRFGRVQRSAIV